MLLDTNALMMPVELDVRLFDELTRLFATPDGELTLAVPQPVIEELRQLADSGGEEGIAASVGHDLATDRCVPLDAETANADGAITELATAGAADYVVTNDKPLQDEVLNIGVPVISLRGSNTLAITEP